jgi:hypothetical protein
MAGMGQREALQERATMKCPACGAEAANDVHYCPQCGAEIEGGELTPAARATKRLQPSAAGVNAPDVELWTGGYSPKAMFGNWIACGATTIGLLVLGIITSGWWTFVLVAVVLAWASQGLLLLYRRLSVRYRLTTQRFIHESGLLARTTNRMEVIDMDDITFRQSLFERFFNVGTLRIISSDRTDPDLKLPGIDNIADVAAKFDDARRAERRRRGLHIESI